MTGVRRCGAAAWVLLCLAACGEGALTGRLGVGGDLGVGEDGSRGIPRDALAGDPDSGLERDGAIDLDGGGPSDVPGEGDAGGGRDAEPGDASGREDAGAEPTDAEVIADAGPDAGPPSDAGPPRDGGRDAGIDGGRIDGGIDAGGIDAGGIDAGGIDAGGIDAGGLDAGPGDGGAPVDAGPAGPPYALGIATSAPSNMCPSGGVPTSACLEVDITGCPGIAPSTAYLKITDPAGPPIGTVVLGTGGGGTSFYEMFGPSAVNNVIQPLVTAGFRVIQRMWQASWLNGPGGARRLACRYATLLDLISRDHASGVALCVSGNSGGSAEISYALAQYGMGRVIDLAVPSAGPPLGRVDYGCLGALVDPTWPQTCASYFVQPNGSCEYGGEAAIIDGTYGPANRDCSTHAMAAQATFAADSVLTSDALLSYPNTEVRFVYGGSDLSSAVPLGRLYADAVQSAVTITIVPGVPHEMPGNVAGASAIGQELLGGCVLRH